MQRLTLGRKRILIGLLLLLLPFTTMIPVSAQDDAVEGDIFVAKANDGQLIVFSMDGNQANVIVDESMVGDWRGWRLSSQEILLYTVDASFQLALVNADGLQLIALEESLQSALGVPRLVNTIAPYAVLTSANADSDYAPAVLVDLNDATADLLSMDYAKRTPFRLSEDGAAIRYAIHGEEATDQYIIEQSLESGETTIMNITNANGRLIPDQNGETWVEILPTPISPNVTILGIDGESEDVASGTQEAWYWVVDNYLITNTTTCEAGNCLFEFRSLLDDSTFSVAAPEGIGFFAVDVLDDGQFIVGDANDNAFWKIGVEREPVSLGFSTRNVLGADALLRLTPNKSWFVAESVAEPGDSSLSVRIYNASRGTIVASVQSGGSIHDLVFGEEAILIETVTESVLYDVLSQAFTPLPSIIDADFQAVLPDNTLLYSNPTGGDPSLDGVYHLDPTSDTSTLLFENTRLLSLD